MSTRFCLAATFAAAAFTAHAGDIPARPTFTKDVLPIFQENCVICHRPGGHNIAGMVAPFSLTSYDEARPWAKAIERVVQSKEMPPWYASEEFHGVFANERGLNADEIEMIAAWARTGATRGNPADAPAPLEFEDTGGWIIGKPDLVIEIPEPYLVRDDVEDEYANFVVRIPEDLLPEDRWLRAVEWRPDAKSVHHIVGYETYSGGMQGLGSIAPGEEPHVFQPGYGKILHKGAAIRFSMHYHKEPGEGTAEWDRSSVGFRFWDPEKDPPIRYNMIWDGIANGGFEIPPHARDWRVGANRLFNVDTTIVSLHPHMHLRGTNATYIAYYPDGSQETLLYVPKWDFDWQLDYTFKEPKKVPAGTRVEYVAHFDNSADNPNNPDPQAKITFGEATTDEMMIGFIHYSNTKPIDETDPPSTD